MLREARQQLAPTVLPFEHRSGQSFEVAARDETGAARIADLRARREPRGQRARSVG